MNQRATIAINLNPNIRGTVDGVEMRRFVLIAMEAAAAALSDFPIAETTIYSNDCEILTLTMTTKKD